jgi:hypothetical protein
MEIVDRGAERGEDLIQVAYADTREEAALVRGLLREEGIRSLAKSASYGRTGGTGLVTGSPRRIYVMPEHAERARELLGEVMVEEPEVEEFPEPLNAAHLADATGHKPRDYNIFGFYARTYLVGFVVLGIVLLLFLLLH